MERKFSQQIFSIPTMPSTSMPNAAETPEEQRKRFEIECEFVQTLANPNYLNFLAQRGYFKEEYFINYLKYLLYWRQPQYARCLKYPQTLFMLEVIQDAEFRKSLQYANNAKTIEDQMVLQWQYYMRKRARLHEYITDDGVADDSSDDDSKKTDNSTKTSSPLKTMLEEAKKLK